MVLTSSTREVAVNRVFGFSYQRSRVSQDVVPAGKVSSDRAKIHVPPLCDWALHLAPIQIEPNNIAQFFEQVNDKNKVFWMNAASASFADNFSRFPDNYFILMQSKQKEKERWKHVNGHVVAPIKWETLKEEYDKCFPATNKFLSDANSYFVSVTDEVLTDDVAAMLYWNMIIIHAGNDHLFYGEILALRKRFSHASEQAIDERTVTRVPPDDSDTQNSKHPNKKHKQAHINT